MLSLLTVLPLAALATAQWEYRLVGPVPTEGRLEVRPNSSMPWGTVCDDGFTRREARVACTSLGMFGPAIAIPSFGGGSGPIYMDDVTCTSAQSLNPTSSLSECTRAASHNCDHSEDVGVNCLMNATSSWEYRLAGSRHSAITNNASGAYMGRLEVRPNSTASWGTVCDDNFFVNEAMVACRSLGLTGVTRAIMFDLYGGGTGEIYMDDVECSLADANLAECGRAASSDCTHAEDVGLLCVAGNVALPSDAFSYRLFDPTRPGRGALEIQPDGGLGWGAACSGPNTTAPAVAAAACRSLGFNSPPSAPVLLTGYITANVYYYLSNVECATNAASLTDCSWSQDSCTTSQLFGVDCGLGLPTPWQYRLADGNGAGNATNPPYGRLEVRPNSSAPWGTVCDDDFNSAAATAACNALGFATATTGAMSFTFGGGAGPIYMDDVLCRASWVPPGANFTLDECAFTQQSDCDHTEDVGVFCTSNDITNVNWEWRLEPGTGGTTAGRGRLQLRPGSSAPWGTICANSIGGTNSFGAFTDFDAIRACHSLGYSAVRNASAFSAANGTGPVYAGNVYCETGSDVLQECMGLRYPSCGHPTDIGIDCHCSTQNCTNTGQLVYVGTVDALPNAVPASAGPTTWQVRLTNASESPTLIVGRLEVRPNAQSAWGSVCDDSFGAVDAAAACRSLGYAFADRNTAMAFTYGPGNTGPIYMDDVQCAGMNATFLHQCTYNSQHNCVHAEDVGVRCPRVASSYSQSWEGRLSIVSGTTGRLEVRPDSSAEWGTVCDDSFDASDAAVACRWLGYSNGSIATSTAGLITLPSTVPIWMDDVNCVGTEATLASCDYNAFHNCVHAEDIFVTCAGPAQPTTPSPSSSGAAVDRASSRRTDEEVAGGIGIAVVVVIVVTAVCVIFMRRSKSASSPEPPSHVADALPPEASRGTGDTELGEGVAYHAMPTEAGTVQFRAGREAADANALYGS